MNDKDLRDFFVVEELLNEICSAFEKSCSDSEIIDVLMRKAPFNGLGSRSRRYTAQTVRTTYEETGRDGVRVYLSNCIRKLP